MVSRRPYPERGSAGLVTMISMHFMVIAASRAAHGESLNQSYSSGSHTEPFFGGVGSPHPPRSLQNARVRVAPVVVINPGGVEVAHPYPNSFTWTKLVSLPDCRHYEITPHPSCASERGCDVLRIFRGTNDGAPLVAALSGPHSEWPAKVSVPDCDQFFLKFASGPRSRRQGRAGEVAGRRGGGQVYPKAVDGRTHWDSHPRRAPRLLSSPSLRSLPDGSVNDWGFELTVRPHPDHWPATISAASPACALPGPLAETTRYTFYLAVDIAMALLPGPEKEWVGEARLGKRKHERDERVSHSNDAPGGWRSPCLEEAAKANRFARPHVPIAGSGRLDASPAELSCAPLFGPTSPLAAVSPVVVRVRACSLSRAPLLCCRGGGGGGVEGSGRRKKKTRWAERQTRKKPP